MNKIKVLKTGSIVLSVLIALLLVAQFALTFIPYFTITPLATLLNPNPAANEYSIFDLCWVDTLTITEYFTKAFKELGLKTFTVNDHVIMPVLTMVLALAAIVTSIVHSKDLVLQYPHTVSGTLLSLFSLCWIPCGISAYTGATILYIDKFLSKLDVILPAADMVRSTSLILIIVASVLMVLRVAAWVLTLVLEKKAREARIAAEEAAEAAAKA